MNCYLIIWPPENSSSDTLTETFPLHHKVLDGVWVVAGEYITCVDVCEALGIIGEESKNSGVVLRVNAYYGQFDRALWKSMDAWTAKADTSGYGERLARVEATLATRVDLADLRTELKADIADLRAELKAEVADVKTQKPV